MADENVKSKKDDADWAAMLAIAKTAHRRAAKLESLIITHRNAVRTELEDLLKIAGLYNCPVLYKYNDVDSMYVKGKLVIKSYTDEFDVTIPFVLMFDGGEIKRTFFTHEADYLLYLIKEVFPKLKKCED